LRTRDSRLTCTSPTMRRKSQSLARYTTGHDCHAGIGGAGWRLYTSVK
jgi:hypothetical protein